MSALPASSGGRSFPSGRTDDALPPRETIEGPYELDFARSVVDIEAIQRLRFDVFNLELDEGLDTSNATGLDQDAFDQAFDHLFVRHRASGRIVGTYRMQTRQRAEAGLGFYSATEFDLSTLPDEVLDGSVEIGRACIHKEHRSLQVLYLLWKGIGRYASFHKKHFLFGCCSLTSQDPEEGWSVYRQLEATGRLHAEWRVRPLATHTCPHVETTVDSGAMPRLMRTYLSLGASICSEPAIDLEFKTIDFLALFDFESLQHSDLAFYRFRS